MVSYKTTYRRRRSRSSRRKNVKSRKVMKGGMQKHGSLNTDDYQYDGDYILEERLPNGRGKMYYKDSGDSYSGDFVRGVRQGKGKMTYSSSRYSYSGDFVGGVRQGKGTMTFPNGTTFTGTWSNDEPIGKGTIVWNDRTRTRGPYPWPDNDANSDASTQNPPDGDDADYQPWNPGSDLDQRSPMASV